MPIDKNLSEMLSVYFWIDDLEAKEDKTGTLHISFTSESMQHAQDSADFIADSLDMEEMRVKFDGDKAEITLGRR